MPADVSYAELLARGLRDRLTTHRAYLDNFELVDLMLEGNHPDQRLVVLFRRSGSDRCLWGSRSPSLWSGHEDPDLDWLPLDPHTAVDEYVDLIFHRLDERLWPLHVQDDGPCNPDAAGISWTAWQLGS